MKILLVTQYFYPENFKSNDIAIELAKRGYDVTVLTGLPNYPKGKIYKGYGIFKKRKETVNGVKIIRTLVIPRGKGGGMMLALNYISWAVIASFRAFFLALNKKFDTVIVHETSPITQGFPALVIKKIQSIPIYFWVLDLWPESLQSAGGINNRYVLDFFTAVTRLMYRKSDKILISSRGFRQSILEKGDFADKLIYFPNWAEDIFSNINKSENLSLPELPNGFRIIFAGNIGEAQDFEHVMKAALLLKENKSIKFILIGDGRKKLWVDNFINKNNLNDTVYAIGRFPIETMPYFFSKADVMLLSLKDDYIFSLTAPAKLQAYMAAKKPVVAMINGEARNLIAESGCGLSVPACDSKGLADNILELQAMHPDKLKNMGLSGFNYYKKYFTKDICITNLENILKNNEAD